MRSLLAGLLIALLPAPARGADSAGPHELLLKNGLRVITLEDHSCPVVAIQVWYHVGSKNERAERTGFAHMFEHMMFRGTDRLGPEGHMEFVRKVGGDCNAYTAFDQTVYVQKVPSNQLPMVFWLEAERMARLKVNEQGFATERAVVAEEWRQGINQPYGAVLPEVLRQVFTVHPYRWSPIGDMDQLNGSTAEELLRFWETYYVPNNATVVVVGDVDHTAVEAEAKRAFGWIPRCAQAPRVTVEEPLRSEPLDIRIKEERGPVPIAAVAFRTVPQAHEDALPLEMLMGAFGGDESSRLVRVLVDEEEKAAMAMAGGMAMEQVGVAAAGAIALPFSDLDAVVAVIDRELERLKTEPITDAELARVKAGMRRSLVDESMTVEAKANQLGTAALFLGGPRAVARRAQRIDQITTADLKRVAETYLVPARRINVRVEPTLGGMMKSLLGGLAGGKSAAPEAAETPAPAAADESAGPERRGPKAAAVCPEGYPTAPPVADALSVRVPMNHFARTLDNGLKVVVVENHEVQLVGLRLGLDRGALFDPPGKDGCAALAAGMITKGTERQAAKELAAELDAHAIELGASVDIDSGSVSGSATTGELGRLARLFAEVVQRPTFPEAEFRKLKRQALTGITVGERSPKTIAERAFRRAIYGDAAYAREAQGTSDTLKQIEVKDCADWWRQQVAPGTSVLYFAGDVDVETAFELAEVFFGDWQGEPRTDDIRSIAALPVDQTHITLVDLPGAVQSEIRVGAPGILRRDERYCAGRVISQIFGGAFNSRLNRSIRIEKGLTYGAFGGLRSHRYAGEFLASTFSKTASTAEAVAAILAEIERLRDVAPTDDELSQAQSFLLGSFPGDHETPASIVSELWNLQQLGLDADEVERYLAGIAKVDSAGAQAVARSVIDPTRLRIVVVGDASRIEAGLQGIAPVTVVDADGKPKVAAPVRDEEQQGE